MSPLMLFYLCLGFTFQFPSVAMRYWMMDTVQVSPSQMAAIFGIVSVPWCLKPVFGFISDSKPLFGYRRKPYMIISAYVSSFMWILLPFCPHDEFVITFVMTLSSAGLCFADVMADSLLVEEARLEDDNNKGNIQSWAWMMRFAGGFLASIFGTMAYETWGYSTVFLINSMVPIVIANVALFVHEPTVIEIKDWRKTSKTLFKTIRQPGIYKPALFIFMICVTPGYGSVMTFFYEGELGFTPKEFGALDVMGYTVAIIGTWIYKKWLTKVSFRKMFGWSIFISFLLENTLFFLIFHTNRQFGIPDFAFAFVERVVITLVGQFITMPMVVLGAQICPPGIEGSLYALLMSITNIGGVFAEEGGSLLTNMFGITGTNFTNLWKLMLICHLFDLIPLSGLNLLHSLESTSSSKSNNGGDVYLGNDISTNNAAEKKETA